jgi:putative glutamine amidotransferase
LSKPLIGISTQRDKDPHNKQCGIGESYITAVIRAGGIPVLLPIHLSDLDTRALLQQLQGLIVTGGPDINPVLYGANLHPKVQGIDVLRDQSDLNLVRAACDLQIPILGICRGFQIINVAFGGQLYTDVSEQHSGSLHHTCYPGLPYDLLSHSVQLEKNGRLAAILQQDEIQVNSLHHQGVRRVGSGLSVTATAPDGLVEGFEIQGYPFGLATQWHPELLPEVDHSKALFKAFVQAAAGQN